MKKKHSRIITNTKVRYSLFRETFSSRKKYAAPATMKIRSKNGLRNVRIRSAKLPFVV